MPRITLQPAFVLHSHPYHETSLLLEVFSVDYGRIGLVARGVRNAKSRLRGLLQPFTPLWCSWSGKGELFVLTTAEIRTTPVPITGRRLYSALYINELLLNLLARNDPYPGLFEDYHETLTRLADETRSEELSLRIFEKRLLTKLGYGLLLDAEAETGIPIEKDKAYRYIADTGPLCDPPATRGGIAISGHSLLALHNERLDNNDLSSLREIKHLMRDAIQTQLNGKPLKTRQLLMAQRLRKSTQHPSQ